MATFADHVLDRCIGPEASRLTEVDIPDMSNHDEESAHWVANHFLNVALRGGFQPPLNAYAHAFLRRCQSAFADHGDARVATLSFVDSGRQSVSQYASAMTHWEYFLSQSWQAYSVRQGLFNSLSEEDERVFERGDGSKEEALNGVHNAMKHGESRIEAGQIIEEAVSPVWLTNEGLRSTDRLLTYADTGEVLRELAEWASILVDPREAGGKLRAKFSDKTTKIPSAGT